MQLLFLKFAPIHRVSDIKVYRHINTKRVIQCQNRCKLSYESKQSPPEMYAMVKLMQSPRQNVKSHLEKSPAKNKVMPTMVRGQLK